MKILDRLPFSEGPSEVVTPDGIAEVRPYQIIIMVSVVAKEWMELPPGTPGFPAILDTGNNHNFALRREHAEGWARLRLPARGRIRVGGQDVPLVAARV
jgi:hypothetical protein